MKTMETSTSAKGGDEYVLSAQLNEIRYAIARLRAVIEETDDLRVLDYVLGGGGVPRLHLRAKIRARRMRELRGLPSIDYS